MTTREEKAVRFFTSGDNCAQSVLKAYCDLVGLTEEQAALVSVAFGGGIGRLRGNCGAFSAAIMVCGALDDGDGASAERRADVYARAQRMHAMFIERCGTINCAELLGRLKQQEPPQPEPRTEAYYAGRPCARIIRQACAIVEAHLAEKEQQA